MADEEIEKTQTNLREVLYCIKYSNDKDKLDKIISEKHERFEMISLNAKNVIENVNCLTVPGNRKGGYNMCRAIEGMKEDAEKKGARKNQDALI